MMGRERNEQIAIQSSIALLQERFRELQRVREMRAEQELLRKRNISHHQPNYYTKSCDDPQTLINCYNEPPSFSFFQFIPIQSPTSQVLSLSLCLDSMKKGEEYRNDDVERFLETPLLASLRPAEKGITAKNDLKCVYGDVKMGGCDHFDDVDTSLHL